MHALNSYNSTPVLIDCRNVEKRFYYYSHRTTTVREWFIRTVMRRPIHIRGPEFQMTGFNLQIRKGEVVALIGQNGSGKSTALRMIAGIYAPTSGTITTRGKVTAVIELGAGFHPELTGLENATLYGTLMGIHPKDLHDQLEEILEFADIGDFIYTPVKYYSFGMMARLAFAVAVSGTPDVILIDEVLAVGDAAFRERCIHRIIDFQKNGGTTVVVTHELATVEQMCDRAVWLENGIIRAIGHASVIVAQYRGSILTPPNGEE